ncbi:unnamed protein product [Blumeria hordei]|uniref:Uncharacterized protein n=2 Tax=Blumeria hordei TaxID=2867405 RepID=A0A383V076_BLUHO|nr:CSEP0079 putative effector protein [Blumeria hordei DH14]SZF06013.1 unnamed protein product [Blumeria hordei]
MGCVFAFLSTIMQHLVLINLNSSDSLYRAYHYPNPQFPELSAETEIYHFRPIKMGLRALTAIYCSPTITGHDLLEKIGSGHVDVTAPAELTLQNIPEAEESCLAKVRPLLSEISISQLLKIPGSFEQCTSKVIASLAFNGIFQIYGSYKCFAPRAKYTRLIVKADIALKMENLFSDDDVVFSTIQNHHVRALLWYQGHLHIFERRRDTHRIWVPITTIGSESTNGRLIADFVRRKFFITMMKTKNAGDYKIINSSLTLPEEKQDLSVALELLVKYYDTDDHFLDDEIRYLILKGQLCKEIPQP